MAQTVLYADESLASSCQITEHVIHFSCYIVLAQTSDTLMNRNARVGTVALFQIVMKECAMPHC